MSNEAKIFYVDGGFSKKRNPQFPAYGSYRGVNIKIENKEEKILSYDEQVWFTYKNNITTNNQSEFATMIRLLEYLKYNWNKPDVLIRLDSLLVLKSLNGEYLLKEDGLKLLQKQALITLQSCKFNVILSWVPGELVKAVLGH